MGLMLTNTLSRKKEELVPREPGKIGMYVCGPTVYNHIHIGNARAAIVFDVIRRYLTWRGFEVTFVQNYTDVDDKIIAKAKEEGRSADEVASDYSLAFEKAMKALDVDPPDLLVKATDHVTDMVEMIRRLIDNGFAYEAGGSVWFAVEKFPGYGKLSGRALEDVRAGERVEPDPNKNSPLDFALWKAAKPDEPAWDSPWGKGRPGWHIECSTMATRYLGMGFDIHGGGSDLIFPHHENEIAQAEAATGESPFVRYWLHNGMVNFDQEKMSKSLGNFVLVKDFLQSSDPEILRLMAVAGHYRSDIDFGESSFGQARRTLEKLKLFARAAGEPDGDVSSEGEAFLNRFREVMDDDFNTPRAISVLHDLVKTGNAELEAVQRGDEPARARLAGLNAAFRQMTQVLGIVGSPKEPEAPDGQLTEGLIQLALDLRERARKDRRFDDADLVREQLGQLGVILEDTPSGTRWRLRA